jgi:ribonuclease HI
MCSQGQGIGFCLVSPHGVEYEFTTRLEFTCTNNQAEYEALLSGMEMLIDVGARSVKIFVESKLTVQQITGQSQFLDGTLNEHRERCMDLLKGFEQYRISHVSRDADTGANALAQQTSSYDVRRGKFEIRCKPMSGVVLVIQRDGGESASNNEAWEDWRKILVEYISNPSSNRDRKVKQHILKYTVVDGGLYR